MINNNQEENLRINPQNIQDQNANRTLIGEEDKFIELIRFFFKKYNPSKNFIFNFRFKSQSNPRSFRKT